MNEELILKAVARARSMAAEVVALEQKHKLNVSAWSKALLTEDSKRIAKADKQRSVSAKELDKMKAKLKKAKANFWKDTEIYCDPVWQNYWGS